MLTTLSNPFYKINEQLIKECAGKTIAVDMNTGDILLIRTSIEILQHMMQKIYPNVVYAQVTLPENKLMHQPVINHPKEHDLLSFRSGYLAPTTRPIDK